MPGIVGCVTRLPRERAEAEVRRMTQSLHHEEFYTAGTWADESQGVYLGWVARIGSFSERMPLRNEQGDVVLTFSGEEFPPQGTARLLQEHGHEFASNGPSYLVHLYEENAAFPEGLNGRFHGFLVDRSCGTAVLFNDRYGMHRIYYYQSPDSFYFAAEAKAILAVRPEARKIDPRALGEFVACGCTLEDRSLFENVHLLPGGSKWVFRNGALIEKKNYFKPEEWEDQVRLESEPCYQEFREVFSQNLPRYFEGGERVGMSLTGGLDSRMIMAWGASLPASLPCYTFSGPLRECQDIVVGRRVASACGQTYEVIKTGNEFLSQFSSYAERTVYLTDGCADVSRSADLYLNAKARKIAPVRLTGLFGGEILRRVRSFKAEDPLPGVFAPEFLCNIRQAHETDASLDRKNPALFAAFKQAPWQQYGGLALEQTQVGVRTPFLDNDFVCTACRAPQSALASNHVSQRLIADGNRALIRIPTDRGLGGSDGRLSEIASRARLEFLFKAEYAYDIGMPQWLAQFDHALSALRLERLFLGRHKIFHYRVWYREALAEYVQEMLLDPRTLSRPFFRREGIEAMVRGHLTGNFNYTNEIHKVLTLELLYRLFLDAS
jgi:asparagine synthase (glutamine-hydrolysing)